MKISGFENIISIDKFEYDATVNEYPQCFFSASIRENDLLAYRQKVGSICVVENDNFKFRGIVTSLEEQMDISGTIINVQIKDELVRSDIELKKRVFQKSDKNISDILTFLSISEMEFEGEKEELGDVYIQNNETDWQFLKRIVAYTGNYILVSPNKKKVGLYNQTSIEIEDDDIIFMRYKSDWMKSEIKCRLKKVLQLGDKASYDNKSFFVSKIQYQKIKEEFVYTYMVTETQKEKKVPNMKFYKLVGTVLDNNDPDKMGRVKINFDDPFEDSMKEEALWMSCFSSFASKSDGIICIPSIGDKAIVVIESGEARVATLLRTDAFGERYSDCNNKYLLFKDIAIEFDGEFVKLNSPKVSIEISNEEVSVNIGEDVIIQIDGKSIEGRTGKNKVKIEKNSMSFITDGTNIEMTKELKVKAMNVAIDGRNRLDATANNINIKGKAGVSIN